MWESWDVEIAGFSFLTGLLILTKDASWPKNSVNYFITIAITNCPYVVVGFNGESVRIRYPYEKLCTSNMYTLLLYSQWTVWIHLEAAWVCMERVAYLSFPVRKCLIQLTWFRNGREVLYKMNHFMLFRIFAEKRDNRTRPSEPYCNGVYLLAT